MAASSKGSMLQLLCKYYIYLTKCRRGVTALHTNFPHTRNTHSSVSGRNVKFLMSEASSPYGLRSYKELYELSVQDPETFWGALAKERLLWSKPFDQVKDCDFRQGKIHWFCGGQLNVSAQCKAVITSNQGLRGGRVIELKKTVDEAVKTCPTVKHVFVANRTENKVPMSEIDIQLEEEMAKESPVCDPEVLRSEDMLFMLYTSGSTGKPKGIVHTQAGYLLYAALTHQVAQCKAVITSNQGLRGGRVIELKKTVDEAVKTCPTVKHVFVANRTENKVPMSEIDIQLEEEMAKESPVCDPEVLRSEDMLFMLYTSGSTGKPKGIVHTQAGYLLYAALTHQVGQILEITTMLLLPPLQLSYSGKVFRVTLVTLAVSLLVPLIGAIILLESPIEPQYLSSYSGKVFRVTLVTLAVSLLVPLIGAIILLESPIEPQYLSFLEPPLMSGALEPNFKLRQAERLFEGQLIGPESMANIGGVLYTGTADGKIVKIEGGKMHTLATLGRPPCGTQKDEPNCGRPLGIRASQNRTLFVADAYLGLFEVNPFTGEVKELVSTQIPVNGKRLSFVNDLDVTRDGEVKELVSTQIPVNGKRLSFVNDLDVTRDGRKIYFTDSSSKWQRRDYAYLFMEGINDGRLLEYDTFTKEVTVLMDDLRFPNGVQLSPNEDFVLVAEMTMARIRRCYVSGLNKGGLDLFVENLPGFPDNIRSSSSGGYWVAMSAVRPNPGFSMHDFLSQKPWIKKIIFKVRNKRNKRDA
ncbi:UNVERIFIED_CONTAM: hypothetical protein FKN15_015695 [Acipenser sinensis]